VVTGGSRGIGRAIVVRLAEAGAKVAFVYHSSQEAADSLVAELAGRNLDAWALQGDASQKADADRIVDQVLEKWGKVDILVNNAGIIKDALLATMSAESWHSVIENNLTSVFNFCQAVTRPMMGARYGRIVNMSSVSAEYSNPGQSSYAASKAGIEGFTRCMATELAKRNITVNAIAPGFIETDMTQAVRNAAGEKIRQMIPVKRFGTPDDVAHAVLFLVSEPSGYITGQVLKVDGGLTLGGMA
jgi:3-oxoacyl-[acyl-carrier protein] reductase